MRKIFGTNELERTAVVAKYATTAADGKTYNVDWYNLDAIEKQLAKLKADGMIKRAGSRKTGFWEITD